MIGINYSPYSKQVAYGSGASARKLFDAATDLMDAKNAATRASQKGKKGSKSAQRVKDAEQDLEKAREENKS